MTTIIQNVDDVNATTTTTPTLSDVANQWGVTAQADGELLWRFGRTLLAYVEANPKSKQVDIGVALAYAVTRPKPYSPTWVSRALKASRAWEQPPANPAEGEAFRQVFYGHEARPTKVATPSTSPDAALEHVARWVREALNRGATPAQVSACVASAIASVGSPTAAAAA